MATTPISEQIRQNRLGVLRGIKIENGYSFDASVEAFNPVAGHIPSDGLIVLSQGEKEPVGEIVGDGGFQQWRQFFTATVYRIRAKDDDRDLDEILNFAVADVERAINEDNQCNALADLTEVGSVPFVETTDEGIVYTGVAVGFSVLYENREAQPDQQA